MQQSNKSVISLRGLTVTGGRTRQHPILNNVSLEIASGELVYLIGRVGSGKSTLLRMLYGDVKPSRGQAYVAGFNLSQLERERVPFLRRRLGMVFQDFKLLDDRNIYANLHFVLEAMGWTSKPAIAARIDEVLSLVGMERHAFKMPFNLSGGEQQRIAVARAFLGNPAVILADEPTGNLDMETGEEIMSLFSEITGLGCSVIVVTHNLQLLDLYPGRVLRLGEDGLLDEI